MFVITALQTICQTEFLGMAMSSLHTKRHLPSSNGSLIITVKKRKLNMEFLQPSIIALNSAKEKENSE
jgi:hypothetical protein